MIYKMLRTIMMVLKPPQMLQVLQDSSNCKLMHRKHTTKPKKPSLVRLEPELLSENTKTVETEISVPYSV